MALYLQTPELFAREAHLPASAVAATPTAHGARLYDKFCADCHGDHGQGQPGAYPALAGNRAVTMDNTNNLVQVVLGGGFAPATRDNPRPYGMPPFMLQLNDDEVAQVLSHIRTSWGNQASGVSEFDISRLRRAQSH
jgi:mono/diheme cytochrome c family protein